MTDTKKLPHSIDAGLWNSGHIQGIALDTAHEYIYYAFTTVLVKARLDGTVVGWVGGLMGHLGCIDFNDEDGRLYASLELKHDSIGQGIMKRIGSEIAEEDAFYVAVFDVEKITRPEMNAESDGIMKAVYLPAVARMYSEVLPNGRQHRFACSGIDGTGVGRVFGAAEDSPTMLMVACGIYGDVDRDDNDCNIIMQYDWRKFDEYARPLTQLAPHHSGPEPDEVYFLFTGNTNWGIQNLEYDAFTGDWLASVYRGKKENYPNYPMFVIDGGAKPAEGYVAYGEKGKLLSLKREGAFDPATGIYGCTFPKGQTGLYAFGDGYYYISHELRTPEGEFGSTIKLFKRANGPETGFEEV